MKIFLKVLVLVLFIKVFPSYANLNGKGLVCICIECSSTDDNIIGYHFERVSKKNLNIFPYRFKNVQDNITIEKGGGFLFSTNNDAITWSLIGTNGIGSNNLNRKNLILKSYYKQSKNIAGRTIIRKCEVFSNKSFFDRMKKIRNEKQLLHNKYLQKNKI